MARDFNQNRNVNAVLKGKNGINAPGVYYAVRENADGFNVVSVSSLPSVELFIGQGTSYQDDITEWTLFNSQAQYGGIGANAFARFQNLESVTIWQEDTDNLLLIDDNAFYSNVELAHIYVHPDLLERYQTYYSGKSFVSLFEAYELITDLVVPTSFNGEIAPTTLTKAWLDLVFANMPTIEKNAKVNLIIPSYFTGIDVGAFSGLGTRFINLQELKCNGSKTFASGFLNGGSWCKHLWLDNGTSTLNSPYCTDDTVIYANFRVVAPYIVFANYFIQEHNIKTGVVCPIVGYNQFSSGASLPQESPTGEYLWFSNIDFDSDYNSPTGLENDDSYVSSYVASTSGYYYCYDKTEILVIQDDGNHIVTKALVQNAINGLDTPSEWIKVIKCVSSFEDVTDDSFDTIPQNVLDLEFPVKWLSGGIPSTYRNLPNVLSLGTIRNVTIKPTYNNGTFVSNSAVNITGTLKFVGDKALNTSGYLEAFRQPSSIKIIDYSGVVLNCNLNNESNPNNYQLAPQVFMGCSNIEKLVFPASLQKTDTNVWGQQIGTNGMKVIFNSTQVITLGYVGSSWNRVSNFYVRAELLVDFIVSSWSNYADKMVGFLDYTDTVPTWTDYQATWYSDEDCTVQVLPANFVSGNRYYVKLA